MVLGSRFMRTERGRTIRSIGGGSEEGFPASRGDRGFLLCLRRVGNTPQCRCQARLHPAQSTCKRIKVDQKRCVHALAGHLDMVQHQSTHEAAHACLAMHLPLLSMP